MKIQHIYTFLTILFIHFTVSCSKDTNQPIPILPIVILQHDQDKIISKTEFYYNDDNQIIEERFSVIGNESYNRVFLFRYNKQGKIIKRERYTESNTHTYDVFEYDLNGRLISKAQYRNSDLFIGYEKYSYNELNEIDTVLTFSNDSLYTGYISYKYDNKRNRIEKFSFSNYSIGLERFEFDDHPNIFSKIENYNPELSYRNNILKQYFPEMHFEGNNIILDDIENTDPNDVEYVYNNDGFPIKILTIGSDFYKTIEYN